MNNLNNKTILCFIRHGETDWNKQKLIQGTLNNPLNDTGRNQALNTAHLLKDINLSFDVLMTSPLSRAYETMKIIRDKIFPNKEIIINPEVIEREFGDLEGKPVCKESYDLMFKEEVNNLEKLADLKNRAFNAILNIAHNYPNKNILITSHSQFIKGALLSIDNSFDFTFAVKNSSLNFIEIENDIPRIIKYNIASIDDYKK